MKNTRLEYGLASKLLHWFLAIVILVELGSMFYKKNLSTEGSEAWKISFLYIHKPLGVVAGAICFLYMLWRILNISPAFSEKMLSWEKVIAHCIHHLLLINVLCLSMTGFLMSMASQKAIIMFGVFTIDPLMVKDSELASLMHTLHYYLARGLLFLLLMHWSGVIKQHLIRRDPVVKRILPFIK